MPSKKLNEFIEADLQVKSGEKEKDKLKPYVTKLLKRAKRMGVDVSNVTYSEAERFTFLEDELYEWMITKVSPEVLEDITKKTINLEKLEELYLNGIIDPTEIPSTCYKSTNYSIIKVTHKKEKK